MFRGTIIVSVICFAVLLSGCSSQNVESPVVPGDGSSVESNILHSNRLILAAGNIRFDVDSMQVEFVPNRNALAHWNGTPWLTPPNCDDCIIIEVLEFKPVNKFVKLRIALKNPTKLTVFDVRGIMMSNIPDMKLLNADSYTALWDDGGDVEINPFKAFAVDWPQREIEPDTAHARIYKIKYTTFSDLVSTNIVIDASWPDNCKEPYEIGNSYTTGTFFDFDSQDIFCDVYSWNADISSVTIDLSCLGMGTDYPMTYIAGNQWSVVDAAWHHGGFGPGTHQALITATCIGTEIPLFNYVDITIDASPPTVGWAKTWGGVSWDHSGGGIASDDEGNIYIAGLFTETVDFDTGPEVDEHTSLGYYDHFLSKFSATGDFIWVCTWGGTESEYTGDIYVDDSGIYVTGGFQETVDFDPGPGIEQYSSNGLTDSFLSKFNPNGELQWVRVWGGEECDLGLGVILDNESNAYVVGGFSGSVDFDPRDETDVRFSNGERDAFLTMFDSEGEFQWVKTWGGEDFDTASAIVSDNSNNIYVTGSFEMTVDFNPGSETDEHISEGHSDCFLSKFSQTDDFLWTLTWGGGGYDGAYGLDVSIDGNIYITGAFYYTVDFDPGPGSALAQASMHDVYLLKFSTDGDFHWVRTWGGWYIDHGWCVVTGNAQEVYVAGRFWHQVDFDPGIGIELREPGKSPDAFVSKFNSEGVFQWVRTWGGGEDCGLGVDVAADGNVSVTGYFEGQIDFWPGPGEDINNANGKWDVFLTKLSPDGNW